MSDWSDRITQDADRRMAMAREWDMLVDQIRRIDGFEDVLRPQGLTSLLPAAAGGPVVIINISRWRCDALIVTTSGVDVVALPHLQEQVGVRTKIYLDAVRAWEDATPRGDNRRDAEVNATGEDVDLVLDTCLRWMWDTFASTILRQPRPRQPCASHSTRRESRVDRCAPTIAPTPFAPNDSPAMNAAAAAIAKRAVTSPGASGSTKHGWTCWPTAALELGCAQSA